MRKYVFLVLFLCFGTANASFVGEYAVSNWTQSLDGGTIDLSGAPNSITLTSSDVNADGDGDFPSSSTDFTIASTADGVVSFDWFYTTTDIDGSTFDPFGWILNGIFTQLSVNELFGTQSGLTTFNVLAGDIFGFSQRATDSDLGSAFTRISNFSAPAVVPIPAAAWLFGSALLGFFGFSRKKSKA